MISIKVIERFALALFCGLLIVFESVSAVGGTWEYAETADQMGRGKTKTASIMSSNQVDFHFPYNGAQRANLLIRSHPAFGKNVILSFRKAHFLCGLEGCSVLVRFDEMKPERYSAAGPSDRSTNTLFIRNYSRFIQKLQSAKYVRLEAEFYQDGMRVLNFEVSGLRWDDAAIAKSASASRSTERLLTWAELTPQQHEILAPLAPEWNNLKPPRQHRWLQIANAYPKMKTEEQARVQRRMEAWVKLTPEERRAADKRYEKLELLEKSY